MNDSSKRGKSIAIVSVLSVLAVVVVVQSVLLAKMNDRVDALGSAGDEPAASSAAEQAQPDAASPPAAKPAPDLDLDDDWFSAPFDRDGWDPFAEMQRMREQMNRLFDDSFGRFGSSKRFSPLVREHPFSPKVDVAEEADRFIIRVDLPGVTGASVNVKVKDDRIVTISGTREEQVEKSDDDGQVVRQERRMGRFERTVSLPSPVDAGKMDVDQKAGVVTIALPKKAAG
ncbi:MAG: Hsp20/alpha crystallin family protein [Deltaproteobacteria bacterium]|nr:Hsp20/alpha crystallin family protein [Deltaproteobacteria bacterium]